MIGGVRCAFKETDVHMELADIGKVYKQTVQVLRRGQLHILKLQMLDGWKQCE